MENIGVRPPDTGTPVTAVKSRAPISLNTLRVLSSILSDIRSIWVNRIWSPRFLVFSAWEAAPSVRSEGADDSFPYRRPPARF
jgi:hypothetical protein